MVTASQLGSEEVAADINLANTPGFSDVPTNHWAREAILFMLETELMIGTSASLFAPEANLNRAMAATILWRMSDFAWAPDLHGFHDVEPGRWYSQSVAWVAFANIAQGTGVNTFSPQASITREQLVTMLYRFARHFEVDTRISGDPLQPFTDRTTVSPWARDAMAWAVYNGLITGATATRLAPQGVANRAQAAVILMRFYEEI